MPEQWTGYFRDQLDHVLAELQAYVEIESPTHDKSAVDTMGRFIADRFAALGCRVEVLPQPEAGDQLRIEYGTGDEQILVLGHFDTVKDVGTLAAEPWRIEDGRAYGPGTYDMKSGIVFAYFALKAIIEHNLPLQKKLVFFWNSDEETGSHSSRHLIHAEGRRSALALVIEPAAAGGELKTSRKGGGEFTLRVTGRAAHAGNEHQQGINAIEELAHHLLAIQSWTDYELGTTLSVGVIKGGTTSNVVPASAEAIIDVRIQLASEAERVTQLMHSLQPVLPGAQLEVFGGVDKHPMERTAATEQLFRHTQAQAALEGLTLAEIGVGGTSDGNVVAEVGTPVLDGIGPLGDGAHASHEHILIDHIPERIALLLRMLTTL